MKKREPVRIRVDLEGRFMHQAPNGEVCQQQPVAFLADQFRGLAAEDDLGAPQVRLQLVERRLNLPAFMVLGLGEIDEAFAWMDKAIDARDPMMVPIKSYWFFDPLRDDPRFAALLRKMNLTPE